MHTLQKICGVLYPVAIILILAVTAFDVACYSDFGFYEKEYEKYEVLDDLSMDMDETMRVTRHMMDNLRGREESLQISAVVDGKECDFFNEQDLFHMAEVRTLFLGMYRLRAAAVVILAVSLGVLLAARTSVRSMIRCFQAALAVFLGLTALLGVIVAVNFSQAFVVFHHIFFDNDQWLFDPATDRMINMLPEGLFLDATVRILAFFVLFLALVEIVLLAVRRLSRKHISEKNTARKPETNGTARIGAFLLALCLLSSHFGGTALADDLTSLPEWPAGPEVSADAAILIDARSGNILYAKNIDTPYPPASITKILTALIACEESSLSDMVVYSHKAIYSVPYDGSAVGFSEDEAISMKDSLYGLLLKSGNEAANGIAEHIGGSIEAFSDMMNERAAQTGATGSHFVNPNGLHDDEHYTTCHDMALIMREAIHNDAFLEIASTTYYEIPPTNIRQEGYQFSTGHRMLLKSRDEYYEYAIAGKTGYTSKAGNTLVTYAKKDDMELICVILHSIQTQYNDTRTLFDYGFNSFTCYNAAREDSTYNNEGVGFFSFLSSAFEKAPVSVKLEDSYILLPSTMPFSSLESRLEYSEGEDADPNVLGYVRYSYQGLDVGSATLRLTARSDEGFDFSSHAIPGAVGEDNEGMGNGQASGDGADGSSLPIETAPAAEKPQKIVINIWQLLGYLFLAALAFVILTALLRYYSPKQRRLRRAKQMRRIYLANERKKRKKKRELR